MRRLTSQGTFVLKWIFPPLWFGFLIFFMVVAFPEATQSGRLESAPLLFAPIVMAGLGYIMFRYFIWPLADEVWDDGDTMVVRIGNQEQRIALSEISDVSYSTYKNVPRVTIVLKRPSIFGPEIMFAPAATLLPFAGNSVIDEWIERVNAKRGR